jgi:hypothetical protein
MNIHVGALLDANSYKDALRLRDHLRQQLKTVQEQIEVVDRYIQLYEALRFGERAPELPGMGDGAPRDRTRHRVRNSLPPAKIADLAADILSERAKPMTRGELVEALESRGVALFGRDKAKNVGTVLWRFQDRFVNIPGRGYWLKGRAVPE